MVVVAEEDPYTNPLATLTQTQLKSRKGARHTATASQLASQLDDGLLDTPQGGHIRAMESEREALTI